jgi:hypothetical protein
VHISQPSNAKGHGLQVEAMAWFTKPASKALVLIENSINRLQHCLEVQAFLLGHYELEVFQVWWMWWAVALT